MEQKQRNATRTTRGSVSNQGDPANQGLLAVGRVPKHVNKPEVFTQGQTTFRPLIRDLVQHLKPDGKARYLSPHFPLMPRTQ